MMECVYYLLKGSKSLQYHLNRLLMAEVSFFIIINTLMPPSGQILTIITFKGKKRSNVPHLKNDRNTHFSEMHSANMLNNYIS